jgi:hypothetical protein
MNLLLWLYPLIIYLSHLSKAWDPPYSSLYGEETFEPSLPDCGLGMEAPPTSGVSTVAGLPPIQGLDLVLWTGGMGVDLSHFPGYLWFFT